MVSLNNKTQILKKIFNFEKDKELILHFFINPKKTKFRKRLTILVFTELIDLKEITKVITDQRCTQDNSNF